MDHRRWIIGTNDLLSNDARWTAMIHRWSIDDPQMIHGSFIKMIHFTDRSSMDHRGSSMDHLWIIYGLSWIIVDQWSINDRSLIHFSQHHRNLFPCAQLPNETNLEWNRCFWLALAPFKMHEVELGKFTFMIPIKPRALWMDLEKVKSIFFVRDKIYGKLGKRRRFPAIFKNINGTNLFLCPSEHFQLW